MAQVPGLISGFRYNNPSLWRFNRSVQSESTFDPQQLQGLSEFQMQGLYERLDKLRGSKPTEGGGMMVKQAGGGDQLKAKARLLDQLLGEKYINERQARAPSLVNKSDMFRGGIDAGSLSYIKSEQARDLQTQAARAPEEVKAGARAALPELPREFEQRAQQAQRRLQAAQQAAQQLGMPIHQNVARKAEQEQAEARESALDYLIGKTIGSTPTTVMGGAPNIDWGPSPYDLIAADARSKNTNMLSQLLGRR